MDGYLPACEEVAAQYYEELAGVDFSLIPETAPPVTIKVSVAGLDNAEETTVLLSIRQTMECIPEVDTIVEVASMMVAEDGEYSFALGLLIQISHHYVILLNIILKYLLKNA